MVEFILLCSGLFLLTFQVLCFFCSATFHYIDEAIAKLKEQPPEAEVKREPSVFEKLVKIDKHYALLMGLLCFHSYLYLLFFLNGVHESAWCYLCVFIDSWSNDE